MLGKGNCQVLLRISLLLCTAAALSGPDQTPPQQAPQRKLRLLPIGDGTTARARPRHPPDQDELPTYRKALWQLLRRQEQLNVEFVGSRGHVDPLGPTAIAGAHPDGQRHEGHEDWRVEQLAEGLTSRLANSYRDLHIDVAVLWAGLTDIKAGSKPEVVLHGLTRIVEGESAQPFADYDIQHRATGNFCAGLMGAIMLCASHMNCALPARRAVRQTRL